MKAFNKIILSTTLVALFIIMATVVKAQHPAVKDFYEQHKGNDNVHHIVLDEGIFNLLSWIASWDETDEEAMAVNRITKNLNGLDIIVVPKDVEGKYTFNDVKGMVQRDNFAELMSVREEDSRVTFYAQGNEKEVRDMIIFIDDRNEYSIISLRGVLNVDDLQYLADHHEQFK